MIRFEVTGATPEEFAENAMKAWGLLAIGLQRAIKAAIPAIADDLSARPTSPASTTSSPPLQAQTNGSESSSTASKEVERASQSGSPPKNPKVHSDPVNDLFVPETESPASGSTIDPQLAKPTKTAKNSSKGPKLDDLKTRLSEVIVAGTERWGQKRANAYARTLLKRMGAEKLSELEPEKYDEFMIMSALYLSGTAAE